MKKAFVIVLLVLALLGALAVPAVASVATNGTMRLEVGTTSTTFYGKVGCGFSWQRCRGALHFYRQGIYVGSQNCNTTYSSQCYGARARNGLSCGALLVFADVSNTGGNSIRGWYSAC